MDGDIFFYKYILHTNFLSFGLEINKKKNNNNNKLKKRKKKINVRKREGEKAKKTLTPAGSRPATPKF